MRATIGRTGYDLWLKILNRYPIANVPTPLFYYRQHSGSLSSHEADLLSTRAEIKRAWVKRNSGSVKPTVVAVVGAKNTYEELPNVVLTEFADKVLLDYTLDSVVEVEDVDRVLVTTDDPQVVDYVQNSYPRVEARLRPDELSKSRVSENKVLSEVVDYLEEGGTYPDIIVSLSVHCPLRSGEHIGKALDTLLLYNVDSVVSVYEDYQLHYVHASQGMEPLNPAMHRQIRVEREALFTSIGAIRVVWRDSLEEGANVSGKVGHIVMPWWDSFEIKNSRRWLAYRTDLEAATGGGFVCTSSLDYGGSFHLKMCCRLFKAANQLTMWSHKSDWPAPRTVTAQATCEELSILTWPPAASTRAMPAATSQSIDAFLHICVYPTTGDIR